MRISMMIAAAAAAVAISGNAQACETLQDAMARFEEVKNDYVEIAPTMKPEQFTVWTTHLKAFGDRMGKMDYPGACAALDAAANDLGFASADENQTATKDGGKSGGKSGDATESASESASAPAVAAPAVAAVTEDTATDTATDTAAAAPAAGIPGVWQQCPRGRCRN